jgi:tripartite-type tricarboxylate transporter receptor subunit TctC
LNGGRWPLPSTPEHFASFIASEIDKYGRIIRAAHITRD